jgi:hypothetical protein
VVHKVTLTVGDYGKRQGEKGFTTWERLDWLKIGGQSKTGLKRWTVQEVDNFNFWIGRGGRGGDGVGGGFSLLGILRVGEGILGGVFSFMNDGWATGLGS